MPKMMPCDIFLFFLDLPTQTGLTVEGLRRRKRGKLCLQPYRFKRGK
jgi:hypothetical protein